MQANRRLRPFERMQSGDLRLLRLSKCISSHAEIDRRLAIANGVHAPAKNRPGQQHNDDEADDGPNPQGVRNAEHRSPY
jgi:hypothetical protein